MAIGGLHSVTSRRVGATTGTSIGMTRMGPSLVARLGPGPGREEVSSWRLLPVPVQEQVQVATRLMSCSGTTGNDLNEHASTGVQGEERIDHSHTGSATRGTARRVSHVKVSSCCY